MKLLSSVNIRVKAFCFADTCAVVRRDDVTEDQMAGETQRSSRRISASFCVLWIHRNEQGSKSNRGISLCRGKGRID